MAKPKKKGAYGAGTVVAPTGRGKTWAIKWREDGARQYQGGYENKQRAVDAINVINARITAGMPGVIVKPSAPGAKVTIGSVVEDWFEARADSKSVRDNRNRYEKHLAPLLGHRAINSVTKGLIDELVTDLKKTALDPASIERVLYVLSAFYRWAIRRELTTTNPVREFFASLERTERAELRSQHDPKSTPFIDSKADVARLFRALPAPYNIAYALSALAGLRPGEALALEWPDVDLDTATLTVRRRVRHGSVDTPKSGKGRPVPLVPSLVSVLREWFEKRDPRTSLVVPSLRKVGKGTKPRHLGAKSMAQAMAKGLKACGLPAMDYYQAGRHTFASLWVLGGLDIYRLSQVLGHADVKTSQKYAHLGKKAQDEVMERADIKLAG